MSRHVLCVRVLGVVHGLARAERRAREPVMENNTKGVGLFRTEFIFMDKHRMLDENEQFTIYRNLTKALPNKTITIRTLDSGGDKVIEHMPNTNQNPALGLRAIRFCLAEPDVFITQIKALLRASYYGDIRILIPMLSSDNELRQVKLLIERAKDILTSERKKFNSKTLIGGMIEDRQHPCVIPSLYAMMVGSSPISFRIRQRLWDSVSIEFIEGISSIH